MANSEAESYLYTPDGRMSLMEIEFFLDPNTKQQAQRVDDQSKELYASPQWAAVFDIAAIAFHALVEGARRIDKGLARGRGHHEVLHLLV